MSDMQQLLLDISTQQIPYIDTFVTGKNEELLQLVRLIAHRKSSEHYVYLWGENAVGKTHLLKSLSEFPPARYITPESDQSEFLFDSSVNLYLLDDCGKLSSENQIDAFNLFNEIREHKAFMVTTGSVIPSMLSVRDDLRSRMNWGLVYCIHGLTDDEKMAALQNFAQERGFSLSPDILPYLITRYPRDMHSLSMILHALDRYSLQTKRAITLPLLRDMMQKIRLKDE